jgi:anaerobic ribonucleoside-triphosphate reductase activating protein
MATWGSHLKAPKFNIACINQCTEAEGPEKRLAIWFQGCDIRCADCCNPELFDIKPAHILSLDKVLEIITEAKEHFSIEGVTFLGGEPTLQRGLAELSIEIKKMGLGIILFSGRKAEEINEELKSTVDIIIDGGFENDKPDNTRNLIGSANQRLIFITGRYQPFKEWFYSHRPKRMEINISNGLFMTGDKVL